MGLVRWRSFLRGWFPQGADDAVPEGTLRRAVGIASVKTTALSSRWGSPLVAMTNAHSIVRYNDRRIFATGDLLLRDDLSVIDSRLYNRLTFLRMPPQVGKPDYCFVASGSKAIKVGPDSSATRWGIDAPTGSMTAAILANQFRVIDDMNATTGWVAVESTLTVESLIVQDGSALKMEVAASALGTATKPVIIDLAHYADGTPSPVEDFIAVWVRVDNPANLEFLEVGLDVGDGTFGQAFYQKQIVASTQIPSSHQLVTQTTGIADNPAIGPTQTLLFVPGQGESDSGYYTPIDNPQALTDAQQQAGQTSISTAIGTWIRLRMPKTTFQRTGGGPQSWENVRAVRLIAKTNAQGAVIVYWDDLRLLGGAGLQGRYQYYVTFANSVTGSTSNPFPTPVVVEPVQRQPVQLHAIPMPTDPQVDQRWIFRTVGNGTIPFRIAVLDDTTTVTFIDRVADFFGLDSESTLLMSNIQLQFDNDPPDHHWQDVWGPFAGRAWWARSTNLGERGRVFYSARGRPEAVEGFLDVSSDDDPTVKGAVWNGANYVITENRIFQIVGPDVGPFIAREIHGAPGTTEPFAVTPTPRGIAYLAFDGPRLFTGVQSTLISPDACVLLFRGENLEGVTFGTVVSIIGGFVRDEYILSDQFNTVAVNLIDGTWRVIGAPMTAFYYEPDTGSAIVTLYNRVVQFEAEGQLVDGTDLMIPLDWQTPAAQTDEAQVGLVQRLYVEMDTSKQAIAVAIEIDGVFYNLPSFQTDRRATQEWSIGRSGRVASVRLQGALVRRVTLYGIRLDVHVGASATAAAPAGGAA